MNQDLLKKSPHSMKMMWGCLALVLVAAVAAITINASILLFAIPCVIMMGAMMWMMMGAGMGGKQK